MTTICGFYILVVLPILAAATLQRSDLSSPSYMAAVVEYSPAKVASRGKSLADTNADNYVKFIDKAADYGVDIIVFPESSLSMSSCSGSSGDGNVIEAGALCKAASYIPDPIDNVVSCGDDSGTYAYSLRRISCAARDHSMYVVVNHQEKVDCLGDRCSSDGYLIYNTNVAFDRNGRVIARYRKYNLFGESGVNVTSEPIPSIFATDFGVRFGQFICFDLLFETPTLNLTRDYRIADIIFSSHWFSELPYLYSTEAQAAWAYANDANLLSAGYNEPRTASGGSGIYLGRHGYMDTVLEDKRTNVLVISEVPKIVDGKRNPVSGDKRHVYKFTPAEIPTGQDVGNGAYLHKVDYSLPVTTTKLLEPKTEKYMDEVLCDRGFCCEFSLRMEFSETIVKEDSRFYSYRLAIFNGTRSFGGVATGGIKTCGIIACTNSSLSSCGQLHDSTIDPKYVSPTTFRQIDISVKTESSTRDTFFMPITFSTAMRPFNSTEFLFENLLVRESSVQYMQLRGERRDLLTFAIYGRNFRADGSEETKSAAIESCGASMAVTLIAAVFSAVWR